MALHERAESPPYPVAVERGRAQYAHTIPVDAGVEGTQPRFERMGGHEIPFLSDVFWARFSVILVNVWYGAPFFLIMYLAALKSIPEELYDAAKVDGATPWQRLRYVTIPMMRNIIAITMLFSTIVTFANFDIVQVLTQGGPRNTTHMFATYAFDLGIMSGDIPLGAAVSLFMFPILAIAALFILRDVRERASRV